MVTEQPPDRPNPRPPRGWWVAAGLLALLLVAGLLLLAIRGWVPWWWLAGGAGGVALVMLWATGRLHQGLRRPWIQELAGAVIVTGLVMLWVKAPDLYTTRDPEKSAGATATTRAGILTLGAAITAGLVAWVSLAETRRANREADQRDRYAKAIEQLGSGKLDVRLGGIYGLERIAKTSEQDHPTVVEVLSAYVREHTDPTQRRRRPPPAAVQGKTPPRPATDIQAAVTVLGRLPSRRGVSRGDLSGAHLADAQLGEATLADAQLGEATLTGAQLGEANLTGAQLDGATLTGANLATAKNLTQDQLILARGDDHTRLPAGLQRPAHWSGGPTTPPAAD